MVSDLEPQEEVLVRFTSTQQTLFRDIIDMYLEGIEDAQKATIQDDSLGDLETLLKICGGYTETVKQLIDVREQLVKEHK